jgi:hypothetical protein
VRVAAYCVWVAKERVQTCGKETRMARLEGGSIVSSSPSLVGLLESYFRRHSDIADQALQFGMGFPYSDPGKALERISTYFMGLRKDMLDAERMKFEGIGPSLE